MFVSFKYIGMKCTHGFHPNTGVDKPIKICMLNYRRNEMKK